ncbi:hypothetical protein BpHYR1_028251 [Brachionus plicatilis]|uniref:Uncharacterized protein n=1 Tax=Brachionus plicatilis TaxID=10195 RepID=A0A3M7SCT4_BRAPC|nr:hypothetical protein BpHYR1_028251 [Brachionus plicatilis]
MGKKKKKKPQRWQIIGLLKDKTKSNQEIADLVGVSRKCVITTKRNYKKISVVKELRRSARPRNSTSRDESYIFRKIRINPTTSYRQLALLRIIMKSFRDLFNYRLSLIKSTRVFGISTGFFAYVTNVIVFVS